MDLMTWISFGAMVLSGFGLGYALFGSGPLRTAVGVFCGVLVALMWLAMYGQGRGWWDDG